MLAPEDAAATDGRTARVRLTDQPSSYLQAQSFSFAIPPAATIQGVTLTLVRDPGLTFPPKSTAPQN